MATAEALEAVEERAVVVQVLAVVLPASSLLAASQLLGALLRRRPIE
jgi:hypothetical protein